MSKPDRRLSQLPESRPNPTDWGRVLAVSTMIGGALGAQNKLGQGDMSGALAFLSVSVLMAVALAAAGWLINWLTRR
jgi:hypothetical protein